MLVTRQLLRRNANYAESDCPISPLPLATVLLERCPPSQWQRPGRSRKALDRHPGHRPPAEKGQGSTPARPAKKGKSDGCCFDKLKYGLGTVLSIMFFDP